MAKIFTLLLIGLITFQCGQKSNNESKNKTVERVVNLYSQRHYNADQAALARFTEQTGIKVNVVTAGADELINRLEMEGTESPADVFITVDAARLNRAKQKGLFQKVNISTDSLLPEKLKDEEGFWFPITYRARIIVYNEKKVDPSELSTYEDLSSEKWKNRLLIRSSSSGYNQSLLASILSASDRETAKKWASGVVANMARDPKGGDRDQIKAIAAGEGELAVVNTYYLGLLLNSPNPEEVAVGQKVKVFFPNQDGRGAHVNVSGAAVTLNAPNKENAIKLIEFLTGDEIQSFYASNSFEYPASKNVSVDSTVAEFGSYIYDELSFAKDISLTEEAVKIFDEVGWK